jgi:hypothetical protein
MYSMKDILSHRTYSYKAAFTFKDISFNAYLRTSQHHWLPSPYIRAHASLVDHNIASAAQTFVSVCIFTAIVSKHYSPVRSIVQCHRLVGAYDSSGARKFRLCKCLDYNDTLSQERGVTGRREVYSCLAVLGNDLLADEL